MIRREGRRGVMQYSRKLLSLGVGYNMWKCQAWNRQDQLRSEDALDVQAASSGSKRHLEKCGNNMPKRRDGKKVILLKKLQA